MGLFYRFVASSMSSEFNNPENGLFTPYSALLIFSLGIFISNFIWNTYFMYKPIEGDPVKFRNYISNSTLKTHLIGILGGIIWCLGMSLSLISVKKQDIYFLWIRPGRNNGGRSLGSFCMEGI